MQSFFLRSKEEEPLIVLAFMPGDAYVDGCFLVANLENGELKLAKAEWLCENCKYTEGHSVKE